jgi:hypothetical protein
VNEKVVNRHNFAKLIEPTIPCTNSTGQGAFLIMLIPSTVGKELQRDVIRTTWGSYIKRNGTRWPNVFMPLWTEPADQNFKIYFLFGTQPTINSTWYHKLKLENEKYGDIIQEDFIDTYSNLTIKIIMGLKWAVTNCKGAKYVMKVDDDVFVNMPNLVKFLENIRPLNGIGGMISKRALVWREGKWKITVDDFPFSRYPKYAVGCSYIMELPVAEKLYKTSQHVPYIHLEDVYVTGILAKINDLTHYSDKGFSDALRKPPTPCLLIDGNQITSTNWKHPNGISDFWKELWEIDQGRNNKTC